MRRSRIGLATLHLFLLLRPGVAAVLPPVSTCGGSDCHLRVLPSDEGRDRPYARVVPVRLLW